MPRRYQMSTLVLKCSQRFGLDGDDSLSAYWKGFVSEVYGDVYSTVAITGLRYFEFSLDTTTAGLAYISEPADHLSTVDTVERLYPDGSRRRLRQLAPQQRANWAGQSGEAVRWELVDDRLYLYPTPPAGQQYTLRYIPQPPDLTSYADTDVVDVVTPDGEAMLIWGVNVLALAKSERDVTLAIQREEEARARLTEWAALRAFNDSPRHVVEDDLDGDMPPEANFWYGR